jgi:glycine betaine transporter
MSLSIAFFSFRRGMPPLISSCFYPLIGDRIYGISGYIIDILAVFATIFGIATSLGFGALQISSGLGMVFNFQVNSTVYLTLIAVITVLFLASSMTGLDRGIQFMSKLNILLATCLMLFMLAAGPTFYILDVFTSTTGDFLSSFLDMSLSSNPFKGYDWTHSWTLFYWAWWISWSPFVGLFVASISRGRTVREFVLGALTVPTIFTFVWFSVFGGSAFHLELGSAPGIAQTIAQNIETGLFELYSYYPMSTLLTLVTILLLIVFFITSADSATYVLAMMTSNGDLEPDASRKIIWGFTESAVAAILLLSGGLDALQKMAIAAALPFTIIMVLMCRSLYSGMKYDMSEGKLTGPEDIPLQDY